MAEIYELQDEIDTAESREQTDDLKKLRLRVDELAHRPNVGAQQEPGVHSRVDRRDECRRPVFASCKIVIAMRRKQEDIQEGSYRAPNGVLILMV